MVSERRSDPGARLAEVCVVLGPLYRQIYRAVERDGPIEGASVGVRAVLDMLRRGGATTVPEMGREQALSRQFVQRMVNDAAERDWVRVVPNPAHKRSSLIELTPAGRRTIDAIDARERAVLREVGADFTHEEVDACLRVMRGMLAHLERTERD